MASWSLSNRIEQELYPLINDDPPQYIMSLTWVRSKSHIRFILIGPKKTPYEDGWFYMRIKIPESYPQNPPVVYTDTLLFHPNVSYSKGGWVCLDILRSDIWAQKKSSLTMIFRKLIGGLNTSNCDSPLNMDAVNLVKEGGSAFYNKAKSDTSKYAGKYNSSLD